PSPAFLAATSTPGLCPNQCLAEARELFCRSFCAVRDVAKPPPPPLVLFLGHSLPSRFDSVRRWKSVFALHAHRKFHPALLVVPFLPYRGSAEIHGPFACAIRADQRYQIRDCRRKRCRRYLRAVERHRDRARSKSRPAPARLIRAASVELNPKATRPQGDWRSASVSRRSRERPLLDRCAKQSPERDRVPRESYLFVDLPIQRFNASTIQRKKLKDLQRYKVKTVPD